MKRGEYLVYVVDDERVIAQTLAAILTQAGVTAEAFDDPLSALEAAASATPHLLITDVVMPQMTGVDLAIRFRDLYPQCRVLLFSGNSATSDLLEKASHQGHEFEVLAKPVHPSDLLAKLQPEDKPSVAGL